MTDDPRLAQLRASGRPVTKVEYLRALYSPYSPSFPLDAEIRAEIPHDLPGPLPDTLIAYVRATADPE